MRNVAEKSVALHKSGLNCAQSVLCALEEYTQLDPETAKNVAEGFGGGLRCGEVCGSVSGAVMALGLAGEHPTAPLAVEMTGAFKEEFGCIRCQELLAKFDGKGNCDNLIAFAATTAEKMLKK